MAEYITAKYPNYQNNVVIEYEDRPAPPVKEGDVIKEECPVCELIKP